MRRRAALDWVAAIVFFQVFKLVIPAIPQSRQNHHFADQREFFGMPNTLNVISNLPFFFVGLTGHVLCDYRDFFKLRFCRRLPRERWGWVVFFVGVAAVAFGSSYYHLKPNDACLIWDGLPMTVAFTSMIAIFIMERVDARMGTFPISSVLLAGIVAILYRRFINTGVQYLLCIAISVLALLLPPMYTHSKYWLWAAGFCLLVAAGYAASL